MPGLGVLDAGECAERARDGGRDEQQQRADAELQRRGAERAAGRAAELDVGRGLDREQRADEEQERDLHGGSPVIGRCVQFNVAP